MPRPGLFRRAYRIAMRLVNPDSERFFTYVLRNRCAIAAILRHSVSNRRFDEVFF